MRIAVVKEIKSDEYRVALTPAQMTSLVVDCFGWPRADVEDRLRREREQVGS